MKYHRRLQRQLCELNLDQKVLDIIAPLLHMVDNSYKVMDADMQHAETILEESSKELYLRNLQLKNNVEEVTSQLTKVASNIKDVIFEIDLSGRWSYLNSAWEEMTGLSVKESIGKSIEECLKNVNGKPYSNLLDLHNPEANTFNRTLESLGKNGDRIWLEFTIKGIKSDSGKVEGYIGTIVNITNLKLTEYELIKAREKEVKANKAKSEFLSTMSHEIRTPLNAVIGIAHLLLIENPKQEQIENLSTLKYSSEHLLGVVNDILDYDKIAAGSLELEKANFSLKQVLNTVQSIFTNKASKKGISFQIKKDSLLQDTMIGDSTRLSQILTNLVSNAIKFTEHGTVSLEVEVLNETENNTKLLFSVNDTGIGIESDKIDKIFESFAQAHVSTTRIYGGTGLGLAICQRLLQLMGTSIKVESTPNVGSCFSFELDFRKGNPIASILQEENNSALGTNDLEDSKKLQGYKILVVEDNKINIFLIEKFLKKWGVDYDVAIDGKVAVQYAFKKEYDLILMDLQMPVMNGYDASLAIRASESIHNQTIPIYALSASTGESIKKDLLSHGMNGLICKPFNPNELYHTISEILIGNVKENT
ncbi:PAS domain-containing hybrid sensor histidine kinase/response regulator [Maribacter sp. MAR_2009_72]|uniref:PAS domain-containing hybrid sensor histidine kinase/response regulator n=1 Tax=Maribacter sp. MAR_2009_72 TaxID=1250050 RepID=UPI00119C25D4|nr:ATP-binding protein [Maribacter sp. MAR_2009_72]TVZ14034.1 PAS domain S-box-containing protein [Maribacter sp. MAR_2009_72]